MDDLSEFESRLAGLMAGDAPPNLRRRVIDAVDVELASDRRRIDREWNWYWPAIAAAVLVVINLSFVSASQEAYSIQPVPTNHQLASEIHAIRAIENQPGEFFK